MQHSLSSWPGKLILFATILASGMSFLDGTVVNIAIPQIQKDLSADVTGIQWLVNSFSLALASLILVSGSLGDKFGIKKVFSLGIILFTISSFLCGLSSTITQLIAARTLQGIGSAMMIPGSLAIINYSFPESSRGKVIGMWSGYAGGVAALGPFIGGWLVENFNWQSIFFINVPLGFLALFITWKFVSESRNEDSKSLDIWGTILISLGLFGISFGLIEGPVLSWTNNLVLGSLIGGILAMILFVWVERREKHPLVPLNIFKSTLVTGANLVTFFLYFALYGMFFFLVLNFEQVQHYGPLLSGMGLLPFILLITFGSSYGGQLADKIGPRIPMIVGPLIVAVAFFLLAISGRNVNYFTTFMPALIIFGLGMVIVIASLTKSALAVETKYSGAASGVNNAVSRTAALIAVAILGALAVSTFMPKLNESIKMSGLTNEEQLQITSQGSKLGGIEIPERFSDQAKIEAKNAIEDSFVYSFRIIMGTNVVLVLLSALIAYLTITNPKKR